MASSSGTTGTSTAPEVSTRAGTVAEKRRGMRSSKSPWSYPAGTSCAAAGPASSASRSAGNAKSPAALMADRTGRAAVAMDGVGSVAMRSGGLRFPEAGGSGYVEAERR